MKKIIILCFALGAFHTLGAQETLTLSQCLQMAVDNNLSLQSNRNEIAKGKYAISENQAKLYPQINAVDSSTTTLRRLFRLPTARLTASLIM